MKRILITILTIMVATMIGLAKTPWDFRGVVYDVGLRFTPESCSVDSLDTALVAYDMSVIANILRANAVRIEGEDIHRLVAATRIAHSRRLKVLFNPWKMNVGEDEVVSYMAEAAKAAEALRNEGIDLVFVAGCEYSLFNEGVFAGKDINGRLASLMSMGRGKDMAAFQRSLQERYKDLNRILARVSQVVRRNYKGLVSYASGTWEDVDWHLFDIVGVDYYRDRQTAEDYVNGIQRYARHGKPVVVMEVGCCAYRGAARMGSAGHTVLQGTTPDGKTGIYQGGTPPTRDEREQADYVQTQIELLKDTEISGLFVYVFSFPIMPYRPGGLDQDMTSYAIVKTYPADSDRGRMMPPWEPKEAFYRLAEVYRGLEKAGK